MICQGVVFIHHPLIKKDTIEFRTFQDAIAQQAKDKSSLVVIPTGLGKTIIAVLVIAEKLKSTNGKILFLSPTKPLVNQHCRSLHDFLDSQEKIAVFTGEVSPENGWRCGRIVVLLYQRRK